MERTYRIEQKSWLLEHKTTGQWVTLKGTLTKDPLDKWLIKGNDKFLAEQWLEPMFRHMESNFANTEFRYNKDQDAMITIQEAIFKSLLEQGYDLYNDFIATEHQWL
jgi:hypothetical protein